eukprot:1377605-Amorphochlora_amoeboformis.AAC.2
MVEVSSLPEAAMAQVRTLRPNASSETLQCHTVRRAKKGKKRSETFKHTRSMGTNRAIEKQEHHTSAMSGYHRESKLKTAHLTNESKKTIQRWRTATHGKLETRSRISKAGPNGTHDAPFPDGLCFLASSSSGYRYSEQSSNLPDDSTIFNLNLINTGTDGLLPLPPV